MTEVFASVNTGVCLLTPPIDMRVSVKLHVSCSVSSAVGLSTHSETLVLGFETLSGHVHLCSSHSKLIFVGFSPGTLVFLPL